MSGRGGAGNWRQGGDSKDDGEGSVNKHGGETGTMDLKRMATEAVDEHLKMPEKAHHPALKMKDEILR